MSRRGERAWFLFRNENGLINAPTWRLHVGWLAALLVAMTLIWLPLRPYTHHDLAKSALIAPMTIVAFTYLIAYAFAVLLIAISYTMLSIKRLRDRGEPTGLAGVMPLIALLAGAAHWLQPQVPDVISFWYVVAIDTLLAIAVALTIADLGFRPGRSV